MTYRIGMRARLGAVEDRVAPLDSVSEAPSVEVSGGFHGYLRNLTGKRVPGGENREPSLITKVPFEHDRLVRVWQGNPCGRAYLLIQRPK